MSAPAPPSSDRDDPRSTRQRLARAGDAEGYLALVMVPLTTLLIVAQLLFLESPRGIHVTIISWLIVTAWTFGLLFGISGFRHGRDGGKAAATVALAILSLYTFVWLVFALP